MLAYWMAALIIGFAMAIGQSLDPFQYITKLFSGFVVVSGSTVVSYDSEGNQKWSSSPGSSLSLIETNGDGDVLVAQGFGPGFVDYWVLDGDDGAVTASGSVPAGNGDNNIAGITWFNGSPAIHYMDEADLDAKISYSGGTETTGFAQILEAVWDIGSNGSQIIAPWAEDGAGATGEGVYTLPGGGGVDLAEFPRYAVGLSGGYAASGRTFGGAAQGFLTNGSWKVNAGEFIGPLATSGDRVYAIVQSDAAGAGDTTLNCYDSSGALLWSTGSLGGGQGVVAAIPGGALAGALNGSEIYRYSATGTLIQTYAISGGNGIDSARKVFP